MMLLMGMWMSLTKNPMNPMMANPMAVAIAIFWNSEKKKCVVRIKLTRNLLAQYLQRPSQLSSFSISEIPLQTGNAHIS